MRAAGARGAAPQLCMAPPPQTQGPPPAPPAGYAMEKKSSIISIGLTIHNAPVELREKLAVPEAEWPRAIQELCSFPHIEEAAILSTCNRMEIYVVAVSFHRGAWGRRSAVAGGARLGYHTPGPPAVCAHACVSCVAGSSSWCCEARAAQRGRLR